MHTQWLQVKQEKERKMLSVFVCVSLSLHALIFPC